MKIFLVSILKHIHHTFFFPKKPSRDIHSEKQNKDYYKNVLTVAFYVIRQQKQLF